MGITILSILFLGTITFIKYKPVYNVTVSGEALGYVSEKNELDKNLTKYINHREGTISLIDIPNMPEYELELVARKTPTQNEKILEKIEDTAVIIYKTYAITVNGEKIDEVNTEIEAESIISNIQSNLKEGVEFNLGIVEVFKNEKTDISTDSVLNKLTELKNAKTEEYETEQARIEAERLAKEQEEAARVAKELSASKKIASIETSYGAGNISGLTLSNPLREEPSVTSRFGESSSRRRSTHTGLDLAVSLGTPVYPIASGVVTSVGWKGSYGNIVIVDHGDGIESWYAHCNTLNVGVGMKVTPDTCISTVGSTGNSTGPHLHLEIRINGSPINPQNYLY